LLGWPVEATLGLTDRVEQSVALEVLKAAAVKRAKRQKQFLEDLGVTVQNAFVRALGGGR